MGWDAYATGPRGGELRTRKPFKVAAKRARQDAESIDAFLPNGGLNVSSCGRWLGAVTACSVYDSDGWTAHKVRRLWREAEWPEREDVPSGSWWAVVSAREFLRTCAEQGHAIRFSF